jgi:hypothetical protein
MRCGLGYSRFSMLRLYRVKSVNLIGARNKLPAFTR